MKALRFERMGELSYLQLAELPTPRAGADEVLVRVRAAGINRSDVSNVLGSHPYTTVPRVPGRDFAGVTSSGEAVWGTGAELGFRRDGTHAEYVLVPAKALAPKPRALSFQQAAACGVPFVTAWHALEHARVGEGATLLVIGAAGGVGSSLVQLAKLAGMTVIGTVSSPEKAAFAQSMGADGIIYYRSEDVMARTRELTGGRGVDLVLDHVGGPGFFTHLQALGKWGTVVSYNAFDGLPTQNMMEEMRKHLEICPAIRCFSFHIYDHDREGRRAIMRRMIEHLASGAIEPAISARFKLSEVRQAHELLDSGKALGKIIMTR